jgi:hypothetical protein
MKRILLCTAAALMIAVTPAAAGGKGGHKSQSVNANVNIATGKGGILGAVLGTLKGKNGLNVNANLTTTKGGVLGTILGGR